MASKINSYIHYTYSEDKSQLQEDLTDFRIERKMQSDNLSYENAKEALEKQDKELEKYY